MDIREILEKRKELHLTDLSKETNPMERSRLEGMISEDNNLLFILTEPVEKTK